MHRYDLSARPSNRSETIADGARSGILIINADDFGRDKNTTDRIRECSARKALSSASAMVFMEDSERAADLSGQELIDVGLHLNLSSPFSAAHCPAKILETQSKVIRYLRSTRATRAIFNPFLTSSFEYLVKCQIDEFYRIYGAEPRRIDGHHHLHLSANVLLANLLPHGIYVRRNFSFFPGEKSALNRWYRRTYDGVLARRFQLTDYFFSLPPLRPEDRLKRILALAESHAVELETHPVNADEYRFLTEGEFDRWRGDLVVALRYEVPRG